MTDSTQRKRVAIYRYYSPWVTGAAAVFGFGCILGAFLWGRGAYGPVMLAMIGGAFASMAMGRAVQGELSVDVERRQW
jgi:hypothetical protein